MKVTVIIVNYRVKYYLAQCLHSVLKALEGIEGQVVVVDNDSQDDSIIFNRQLYPQVRFIENKENIGFARANNIAISESQSEYVMLLTDGCASRSGCYGRQDALRKRPIRSGITPRGAYAVYCVLQDGGSNEVVSS